MLKGLYCSKRWRSKILKNPSSHWLALKFRCDEHHLQNDQKNIPHSRDFARDNSLTDSINFIDDPRENRATRGHLSCLQLVAILHATGVLAATEVLSQRHRIASTNLDQGLLPFSSSWQWMGIVRKRMKRSKGGSPEALLFSYCTHNAHGDLLTRVKEGET